MTSVKREYFTLAAHQKPSVGDTKMSVLGIDHLGWLVCDGRLLNVKDYIFLFNVIGYAFGGSGAQFNLPNPAGRVLGAIGSGAGLTPRAMGSNVGAETHTLTIAEMPSHNHGTNASDTVVGNNLTGAAGAHTHTINDPTHAHTYTAAGDTNTGYAAVTEDDNVFKDATGANTSSSSTGITINGVADHQHSIATQGGDDPHNNMQPTLFIGNVFIYSGKTNEGNYPYTKGYYSVPATTNLYQNIL